MAHMQPNVKCPIKLRNVKIVNATIDFSLIAHVPLDGYTWILSNKIFQHLPNVRHRKRLLMCLISSATITKNRSGIHIKDNN